MKHVIKKIVFLPVWFLMLLAFSSYGTAQTTGDVRGKVVDVGGKPIVSAFVILTGQDTSLLRAASSDQNGEFEITAVPVGSYSIQVTAEGLHDYTGKDLRVSLGQVLSLAVTVGVTESKVVAAGGGQGSVIETSNAQLGVVMGSVLVANLPLKSRDTFDLLQLQPGVTSTVGADLFFGGDRPGVVSVNGARSRSNNYNINGGASGDLLINSPALQPSPDAISEFRVMSHNYDAELGHNAGSVLNVITKSGSSQFHGSAFEYFRNKAFNARGYFDTEKPTFSQNDFGGTLGGPLQRDKAFFFLSYEHRKLDHGISSGVVTVPTAAERTGDFSAGMPFTGTLRDQMVADVLSSRPGCLAALGRAAPIAAGTPYSVLFPGNAVPAACMDPTAVALLNLYVPAGANGGDTYSGAPLQHVRNDQFTLRLDRNLGSQQRLSFYYYGDDSYDSNPFNHFEDAGANLPGFGAVTRARYQQFNISHDWTINAKTHNELRLVYFRNAQGNLNAPQRQNLVQDSCGGLVPAAFCFGNPALDAAFGNIGHLGITPGLGANYESVPYISLASNFVIGTNRNGWFSQKGNTYQIADTYTKSAGKHTLKFGADLSNDRLRQLYAFVTNGAFMFNGGGLNDVGYSYPLPNFLLGLPDIYVQGSTSPMDMRWNQYHLFAQDSWKLKSNLTLNFGLRWELNPPLQDASHRTVTFNPGNITKAYNCTLDPTSSYLSGVLATVYGGTDCSATGPASAVFPLGLQFPGDNGLPNGMTKTYYRAFAPRVGLAWSPDAAEGLLAKLTGGPGKTSVRMGWGMFYDSNEELIYTSFTAQAPFGSVAMLPSVFLNTPFLTQSGIPLPNPFNGILNPARGSNIDFSQFEPITLFARFPETLRPQYTDQYHFTIQRELPKGMLFQVGYVGSQGHRLISMVNRNPGNAQTCLDINSIYTAVGEPAPCAPLGGEDGTYVILPGMIQPGQVLHMPYGPDATITGPNPTPITLVGIRKYSSPLCQPTTATFSPHGTVDTPYGKLAMGQGCPAAGVPVFTELFNMDPVATSSYNALQTLLMKRFSRLQFVASYTFSKALDNASSFEETVNPYNASLSRAPALFDTPHRFVLSGYWQLPDARKSNWSGHLLNGWALSGILTLQSGFPIRITSTADLEMLGTYGLQEPGEPNMVAPLRTLDPRTSGGYYFDPSSFANAPLGQIGNSPRSVCCGPGIANVDLAVHKSFALNERARLQFNTEVFNLFNHTQFMNPNGDIATYGAFGKVTQARDPRLIQLALRLTF
jgi:hypothetical protein